MIAALEKAARPLGLMLMGHFKAEDEVTILLGTHADFWRVFMASAELTDGQPDPLDRWSKRIIGGFATQLGGRCSFPSDGPPYPPFIGWALKTGRFWQSPVGMMVHDRAELMISLRGALHLPAAAMDIAQKEAHPSPCEGCARSCQSACPVGALTGHDPYDVAKCKAHLATPAGLDCLTAGCLVRRACPVSQHFGRDPEQSNFHMKAFVNT